MRHLSIILLFLFPALSFGQDWDFIEKDDDLRAVVKIVIGIEQEVNTPFGPAKVVTEGNGSGVVIYKSEEEHPEHSYLVKGLILTAKHVAVGEKVVYLKAEFQDGSSYRPFKVVAKSDNSSDVAIIEGYVAKSCKALEVESEIGKIGDEVKIAGYPFNLDSKTPKYFKTKIRETEKKGKLIVCDEEIQPGYSGGPIIKNGKVIGIVSGGLLWCHEKDCTPYTWPLRAGSITPIFKMLSEIPIQKSLSAEKAIPATVVEGEIDRNN